MATTSDLTTLATVRQFLPLSNANQDALIGRLIAAESRAAERYCSRSFLRRVNSARLLDGTGTSVLTVPGTPLVSVQSLALDGVAVEESPDGVQAGYTHDDFALYLIGGAKFPQRRQSVRLAWTEGYVGELTEDVPDGNSPALTPSGLSVEGGWANEDLGVVYAANSSALQSVSANPGPGQYAFNLGTYSFNAADSNASVTMSFGYVPGPVEQSVVEMVVLDMKQRDSIGVRSRGIAGESVSYETAELTPSVKQMLAPYVRRAPL